MEKPVWDDDIDITDIVPDESAEPQKKLSKKQKKKERKRLEKLAEQQGAVEEEDMDADVEQPLLEDDEPWDGTEEMRQRKLKEYMDQVYALDFTEMVCRSV